MTGKMKKGFIFYMRALRDKRRFDAEMKDYATIDKWVKDKLLSFVSGIEYPEGY